MNLSTLALGLFCAFGPAPIADDPDPQTVLTEANELARQGKYEESLRRHVWFHENALRIQPAMSGVRLSFALSSWVELGAKYPKALETLIAIRDKDVDAIKAGEGTVQLFSDVASINDYLDENPMTINLFKLMAVEKPRLASQCYFFAESKLADAKEYALCSRYIPDASRQFGIMVSGYKVMLNFENSKPKDPRIPDNAGPIFVKNTRQMIQILIGSGRKADAEMVQKKALEILNDPAIRSAITDAEKTTKPN
jgi:hypothetical protein